RRNGIRLVFTAHLADHASFAVQDLDGYRATHSLFQVVIDDGAVGRVLAGRFFLWQRGVGVLVPAYARSRLRGKQRCFAGTGPCHLPQGRDVVEDPERAAMRAHYNIIVLDYEVADGSGRHVETERLPVAALIEGYVNGRFGTGKQQPFLVRIFPYHVDR